MRTSPILLPWVLLLGASAASCGGVDPPRRECKTLVWAAPAGSSEVFVEGSWDGYAHREPLEARDDGWYVRALDLSPGEYGYRIVRGGASGPDPLALLTTFSGEEEVSLAIVEDCSVPMLRVDSVEVAGDVATISGAFLAAGEGDALDPASVRAELPGGISVDASQASAEDGKFEIRAPGLSKGKHAFAIHAADASGHSAPPVRAVAWVDPAQASWSEGTLYHVMVDRFRGDGGAVLSPPPDPGSRAGGTLDGLRAEIEKGTFEKLGVSAIWMSPVYTNPLGKRPGMFGLHEYEAYHGYWPLDSRGVEPRIGGEAALRDLVDAAHRHGIRVLLDVVPNHVFEENPRYVAHRNEGWFNLPPDGCPCGTENCGWGEKIETCWFTNYLPDVRFQNANAMRAQADDVAFWMTEFDVDGVRIDAVPMMPRAATRRLVHSMNGAAKGPDATFAIGEVFTGAGTGPIEKIRYYLGPGSLSSAFDFPVMWKLHEALATESSGLGDVESLMLGNEGAIDKSGSILAHMIDNHDTARFVSIAEGNGGADPWASPPAQPTSSAPYRRTKMALGFVLTQPGLPVLYYGDEVALAGVGDPDSRRVMPDDSSLNAEQLDVQSFVQKIGKLRRCSNSLRTGARHVITAVADTYAYVRDAGDGDPVLVFLARKPISVTLPSGVVPPGTYVDVVTGESFDLSAGGAVSLDELSLRVLLPVGSPCHNLSP